MRDGDSDSTSRPPSVVDRYFKKRYKTDIAKKSGEDQLVLTHSNRICVVCLAESHPILTEGKRVSEVNFEGEGWSRLENTVSGKNKRGAQWLERSAPLSRVTCTDGTVYTLCCCVKGQLVEINTNLLTKPSLLAEKPFGEGYIAVILPGLKHFDREVERLKSEEQYRLVLASRVEEGGLPSTQTDKTADPSDPTPNRDDFPSREKVLTTASSLVDLDVHREKEIKAIEHTEER